MQQNKIVECVPNFSEGRDLVKIEKIVSVFRAKEGVKLLDYRNHRDHNRMVVTVIGDPDSVKMAVIEAFGIALKNIDLTKHEGQHPRMGAIDVCPFIPISKMTMEETVNLSKEVAETVANLYDLPVFLYEKSASNDLRKNLSSIRKGGFEGMFEKMNLSEWCPDYGPSMPHPTGGVVAIGARMPLIAYNVNLHSDDLEIAKKIAKKIRYSSGGLPYCKAIGVELKEKNMVQVSMNLTDYTKMSMYQVFEAVKIEAQHYGVAVADSELIGLIPLEAIVDTFTHYLKLKDFSEQRIL